MSTVLIDSRTGSKDLYALLPRGYAELTDLEYADAVVIGNGPDGSVTEAFERKRLSDALSCVRDGRFAGHQLPGLRSDYDFVWLVIEDEIRADPKTGVLQRRRTSSTPSRNRRSRVDASGYWCDALFGAKSTMMWRDFMHWLMTMRRKGGIDDFIFTRNAQETADLIWMVNTWRQKNWTAHKSCDVFNRAQDVGRSVPVMFKPSFTMEIAGKFDGIGYDKAAAIADRFDSADAFWHATVGELMTVDGIGKKLAQSIVEQRRAKRGKR